MMGLDNFSIGILGVCLLIVNKFLFLWIPFQVSTYHQGNVAHVAGRNRAVM